MRDAGGFGHEVELVGGGEFDVTVSVAEKLGEFGLDRLRQSEAGRANGNT